MLEILEHLLCPYFTGLAPDVLTVDHVHVYWYNKKERQLHLLDKESGKLSVTSLPGVTDMFPHGAHLQPLPGNDLSS